MFVRARSYAAPAAAFTAVVIALVVASRVGPERRARLGVAREPDGTLAFRVAGAHVVVAAQDGSPELRVEDERGRLATVAIAAERGGAEAIIHIGNPQVVEGPSPTIEVAADVTQGDSRTSGTLRLAAHRSPAGVTIAWASAEPDTKLRATITDPDGAIVPFGGAPLDVGDRDAPFSLVLGDGLAIALSGGRATWGTRPRWLGLRGERIELLVGKPADVVTGAMRKAGLVPEKRHGRTEPPLAGAVVLATGSGGRVVGAAITGKDGSFDAIAERGAPLEWGARIGAELVGPSVPTPQSGDLVVPTRRMGRLVVSVTDVDRHVPLPSRIAVRGIDGSREPNFGSPSRASGAGPLADVHDGLFDTELPAGHYRVLATRGIEYTVDRADVDVAPGTETRVDLELRHVVDTPGWAGCDLHVHSRGSFDSTVAIEDRVQSLMAQGVDFAVASEHNRIGTYASNAVGEAGAWLTWVRGVEVTTVNPQKGHFNVFPYELDVAPKYQKTTLRDLIAFAHENTPGSIVQVNHPRLGHGIGHFDDIHLDTRTMEGLDGLAKGFDTLEVYNGFDLPSRDRVEQVLRDWMRLLEVGRTMWATGSSDSHTVEYVTAGFPRTYAMTEDDHDGGEGPPLHVPSVIDSLRTGRAYATSGPIVDVTVGTSRPGDTVDVVGGKVRLHVVVRVAPWIDASEIEVLAGGETVLKRAVASRPPEAGSPRGSLAEARRASVVFDDDLDVEIPEKARALVVVVRGSRSLGATLPLMDFWPMAIVNPFLLQRRLERRGRDPFCSDVRPTGGRRVARSC